MVQTIEVKHVTTGATDWKLKLFDRKADNEVLYTTAGNLSERTNGNTGTYIDATVAQTHIGVFDFIVEDASSVLQVKGVVRLTGQSAVVHTGIVDGGQIPVDYANFMFTMRSSSNSTVQASKTVTCQVSKDGAAFANCTNADAEVANGWYKIALNEDLTGIHHAFRFTAAGCFETTLVVQNPQ